MDKAKNKRILAIDPGTRETGVVILDGVELIYYCVKTFKTYRPLSKLLEQVNKVVQELVDEYNPQILAIEKTFFYKNQSVSHLITLADEFKNMAKQNKLKVVEYAPKTIRKHICQSGKATKKETAKILSLRYPELQIFINQDRIWKEKYWQNMFDALAVGITCFEKQMEK